MENCLVDDVVIKNDYLCLIKVNIFNRWCFYC